MSEKETEIAGLEQGRSRKDLREHHTYVSLECSDVHALPGIPRRRFSSHEPSPYSIGWQDL